MTKFLLSSPIKDPDHEGGELTELELRELTFKDVEGIDLSLFYKTEVLGQLVAIAAGIPPSFAKHISMRDYKRFVDLFSDFFSVAIPGQNGDE